MQGLLSFFALVPHSEIKPNKPVCAKNLELCPAQFSVSKVTPLLKNSVPENAKLKGLPNAGPDLGPYTQETAWSSCGSPNDWRGLCL